MRGVPELTRRVRLSGKKEIFTLGAGTPAKKKAAASGSLPVLRRSSKKLDRGMTPDRSVLSRGIALVCGDLAESQIMKAAPLAIIQFGKGTLQSPKSYVKHKNIIFLFQKDKV